MVWHIVWICHSYQVNLCVLHNRGGHMWPFKWYFLDLLCDAVSCAFFVSQDCYMLSRSLGNSCFFVCLFVCCFRSTKLALTLLQDSPTTTFLIYSSFCTSLEWVNLHLFKTATELLGHWGERMGTNFTIQPASRASSSTMAAWGQAEDPQVI